MPKTSNTTASTAAPIHRQSSVLTGFRANVFLLIGTDATTNQAAPTTNEHRRGICSVRVRLVTGCQRCWLAMPMLPEAVLEVDAGLLDDGLRACGAGEEPGEGEGVGELAVGGDQIRVRGQGCPVDLGFGRGE
ncbi:hypothetical protein ACFYO2_04945 [Streptomyces sp. NPDC006602]|uniref:hypothetical protein n=1 Tax=Streptomyces sp. NPDC006602 TaxID=3364751 RepID=UPI00368EA029